MFTALYRQSVQEVCSQRKGVSSEAGRFGKMDNSGL